MTTVFSIGYQGRSADQLCESLGAAGVTILVDVRERAWSQRPEFRKNALKNKLAQFGIEYLHLREAGNPFRPKNGEQLSPAKCFAQYRKHLRDNPSIPASVGDVVRSRPSALFCYEHNHRSCHRGTLIDELCRQSDEIEHIPLE